MPGFALPTTWLPLLAALSGEIILLSFCSAQNSFIRSALCSFRLLACLTEDFKPLRYSLRSCHPSPDFFLPVATHAHSIAQRLFYESQRLQLISGRILVSLLHRGLALYSFPPTSDSLPERLRVISALHILVAALRLPRSGLQPNFGFDYRFGPEVWIGANTAVGAVPGPG